MEHINGVWIPVGIFAMIFVAGLIDLIRTPKSDGPYRDGTNQRANYASGTRPI